MSSESIPEQFTGYAVSLCSHLLLSNLESYLSQSYCRVRPPNQRESDHPSTYQAFEPQGDTFDLKLHSYTPRAFTDDDVDIKIEASGICGESRICRAARVKDLGHRC